MNINNKEKARCIEMNNVIDYLKWRGDLDFNREPLNEVDSLILSILSYNDFEGIVPEVGSVNTITLREATLRFKEEKDTTHIEDLLFLGEIPKFLYKTAETERFGNLPMTCFVNKFDVETTKQFAAVLFKITDKLNFLSFRGTDSSLAGWKEDLQMSFMEEIQSQKEAVIYTEKVMMSQEGDFILGGHSKGGNLAIYAALRMRESNKSRIIGVYNNDGPGFMPEIAESEEYKSIADRIYTYLPESAIVGMLLDHGSDYEVVKSTGLVITQHNPFMWEVLGKNFVRADSLSKESLSINTTIKSWASKLSNEDKRTFVDGIFEVLEETGASSLEELSNEKFKAADAMIRAYKTMDPEIKVHLKDTVDLLFREARNVVRKSITEDIDLFMSRRKTKKLKK